MSREIAMAGTAPRNTHAADTKNNGHADAHAGMHTADMIKESNHMEYGSLLRELGATLGFDLALSEAGTCGVLFDEDEISFEVSDGRLFVMADLGSYEGREAVAVRMLKAANLGLETGFSCIGIDDVRGQFTLCRILEGDLEYPVFEKILTIFVGAVRYWKTWLQLPHEAAPVQDVFMGNAIRA
jgi:hypothetical protein